MLAPARETRESAAAPSGDKANVQSTVTLAFASADDPLGDGFQVIQSLIAVGTGGIWGKGLMNGVQKLFYLPEPHTDFIYAVIAEELGFIGATAVVLCFGIVTWRTEAKNHSRSRRTGPPSEKL